MNGLVFGLDLGLGACGWAVLRPGTDDELLAMGTWMFDVPETAREQEPTPHARRAHRLMRRTLRRRARRMAALRHLFHDHGLLACKDPGALGGHGLDPWRLRAEALDRLLSPLELAIALAHLARRRGYRSARTGDDPRRAEEQGVILKALEQTTELLAAYRSIGEMFDSHPGFAARKRNRPGVHDRTQTREAVIAETSLLFDCQRRLGNRLASQALEQAFSAIAFHQEGPLPARKAAPPCPLEPQEQRAARLAPSLERLRLLARLTGLRVNAGHRERQLAAHEIQAIAETIGSGPRLTLKDLRSLAGLEEEASFTGFARDEENLDLVARTGKSLDGTWRLRQTLGDEAWATLSRDPAKLDALAQTLTSSPDRDHLLREIAALDLPDDAAQAVIAGLTENHYARFKGYAHISSKAARRILPFLEMGLGYEEACKKAGYDPRAASGLAGMHTADRKAFNRMTAELARSTANPVLRKCLVEGIKQLWAMRNRWGLPDSIQISLAPELGRKPDERRIIEHMRAKADQVQKDQVSVLQDIDPSCAIDEKAQLRLALWQEQSGQCLYTGQAIPREEIVSGNPGWRIDTILPWSRFGKDSRGNLVLCDAAAARAKQGRTPFEWFSSCASADGWDTFRTRVETSPALAASKARALLFRDERDLEAHMRRQNLGDRRSATRLLLAAAASFYPERDRRRRARVSAYPPQLVAALRRASGLQELHQHDDARCHAIDAAILARLDSHSLEMLVSHIRQLEGKGEGGPLRHMTLPEAMTARFIDTVSARFGLVFVARPERRRARGPGHAATTRQVRTGPDGPVSYERKPIADLPERRLADIKDPDRNAASIAAIRQWMAEGRPSDRLPRSPAGHEIRKVRLRARTRPGIDLRGGTADRGQMVRVDLFERLDEKGRRTYHLVPIYPHQVMDRKAWPLPPQQAVAAGKDEGDWPVMDESYRFVLSLHPGSFVELTRANGDSLRGYFARFDRSTGAISLFNPRQAGLTVDDQGHSLRGIGPRTLKSIRKFSVDRLGVIAPTRGEPRTWHGKICCTRSGSKA